MTSRASNVIEEMESTSILDYFRRTELYSDALWFYYLLTDPVVLKLAQENEQQFDEYAWSYPFEVGSLIQGDILIHSPEMIEFIECIRQARASNANPPYY